ncbi:MAG: polysaccharide biosynthesis/export family protein, partial [Gemmatimonadota bacterium]|nr:polysaccharide biosynthesis/export family protein [Gemmatimonadota bacterium]
MKGLTITNHQSPITKCSHRVQRTHAITILICFLLLCSVDLPYAQTALQGMRLPFPPSADTTMDRFQTFDPSGPAFGVSQIMEGSISDSYMVGPGDGFLITVWGKRVDSFQTTVTPEGKLFIPQIAEITVAGLTLGALQDTLGVEISKFMFDVRISVTLVRLRRFQVYVLGGVLNPGPYPAQAINRTQELIGMAGGLSSGASQRNIWIRRQGQIAETVDLLRFNRDDALRFNPYVQDGDVVFVPLKTNSITVLGEVWTPGEYEFHKDDTMGILI